MNPDSAFLGNRSELLNSQIRGLRVAATVFGLMSLAQLARLIIQPNVLIAGHPIPLWPSALAMIVLAGLSLWLWRLAVPTTPVQGR